eukprot:4691577-Amphidinium_carterae.1
MARPLLSDFSPHNPCATPCKVPSGKLLSLGYHPHDINWNALQSYGSPTVPTAPRATIGFDAS